MTILQAAILGLVQGLTEFLPVSSSGHLVLGQALLEIHTGNVTFEVVVHFGTLLAVVTALRGEIRELAVGCLRREQDSLRMVLLLGLGTVPAGFIGLFFKNAIEAAFSEPTTVAGWLCVTGGILWSTRFTKGDRHSIRISDALWIGVAQALAVLPGISRSGTTIGTGLWRGIRGKEAATFSFLLSIPIILGATIIQVGEMVGQVPTWTEAAPHLAGMLVAYGSGVFAIRWLIGLVGTGRLDRFAYYCWTAGIVSLIFFRLG